MEKKINSGKRVFHQRDDSAAESITADCALSLGELVNARLACMKDVAAYKVQNGQNITDPAQEMRVLESAVADAVTLGLNGETVKPFIQAQMDVAKAIQHRYCADWLTEPERPQTTLPIDEVRASIAEVSFSLLVCIARKLKTDFRFTAAEKAIFIRAIQQEKVKHKDKELLWATLKTISC